MRVPRSELARLVAPEQFFWATGIEDTFITAPHPATGRTLDEYALTGHYARWASDLALMRSLGVSIARYGIPWHIINPVPNIWSFEFADAALGRMLDLGIEPIVDLVHYGLPSWIEGAFLSPSYPRHVAEYARRVAERYAGRIRWYTPLNEPRITAWYCGRLGWWPPYERSWRGFVRVMLGVCRGIVATAEALRAVDPEIVLCHVDATDHFVAVDPSCRDEAALRQHVVFLALDLVTGRVDRGHALWAWLLGLGATEADLEWFQAHPVDPGVIGLNLYPMFTLKLVTRDRGRLRVKMPYAGGALVEQVARAYAERYDAPLFVSETASVGSVARRRAWLDGSVEAVKRLRADGIPIVGYTWWPMFSLVTWAYRQGRNPSSHYLKHMGLWDLDVKLERVATPLVEDYQRLVAGGARDVGLYVPGARARVAGA